MPASVPFRLAAIGLLLAALGAAAAEPAPLVKPLAPKGGVRFRVPLAEDETTAVQTTVLIPSPKKGGPPIAVRALVDTIKMPAKVALKTWRGWGYDVPPNRTGTLKDVVLSGGQVWPKPMKGGDVEFSVPTLKVEIVEPPAGVDVVHGGGELWLSVWDLVGTAERTFEPRLHFRDKFLELTGPAVPAKAAAADGGVPAELKPTEGDLVRAYGPLSAGLPRGRPTFAYAAVNGHTAYKTPTGVVERVNVCVSSVALHDTPGVVMTLSTARGCGVQIPNPPANGVGAAGKAAELRLGLRAGPDYAAEKDFVLRDVDVWVTDDKSYACVWLGARFVEEYFKDGVYEGGKDGGWRLYGRVRPEHLDDVKNRPPAKKP